jgi:hypothetical protein
MAEYELKQQTPIQLILSSGEGNIYTMANCRDMLPLYFSGEWLKK